MRSEAWRCRSHGCFARTRTFLGAPPTPRFGVSEAKLQNPGRKNAPRERDGLFDIVSWAETRCRLHPKERACACACASASASASASAGSNARARVSKDEGGEAIGEGSQPAAVGNDRGLPSIVCGLLFTMKSATPTCRVIGNFEMAGPGR